MTGRILKRLALFLITSGIVATSYAVNPGFYLGFGTGYATNGGSDQQAIVQSTTGPITTTTVTPKSKQWGERLFMGYKLNKYAAIEGGLEMYSDVHYDSKGVNTCQNTRAKIRDFEVLGKGMFGLRAFTLYGQGGIAVVYQTTSGDLNSIDTAGARCGSSQYVTSYRPTFGIGASYDLTQNWVVDATYSRIQTGGAVNNMDLYALAISYHFVDVYCGQFLCD